MYCIKYTLFNAVQNIYCIKILRPLEVLSPRAHLEVVLGDAEVELGIADEGELRLGLHAPEMPRTALRYAIEQLDEDERRHCKVAPHRI